MSRATIRCNEADIQTVSFTRETSSQSATTGAYTVTPGNVITGVRGNLQPKKGTLQQAEAGLEPDSDHVFYEETRHTEPVMGDRLVDAAGVDYRVQFIRDYGAAYPRVYELRRIED